MRGVKLARQHVYARSPGPVPHPRSRVAPRKRSASEHLLKRGVGVGVIETVECLFVCAETVSQTVLRGRFVVVALNYVDPLAGF
jgi:hypothetical protein